MGSEFDGADPDFDDQPPMSDLTLDDLYDELTPLQRYCAEQWGHTALDANTTYEHDNVDTTRASNRYLRVFKVALQHSAGFDEDEVDLWVAAAFGSDDDRLDRALGYYGEADRKADIAKSLQGLTKLAEIGDVTALKTEVAGYVAIIRHSVRSEEIMRPEARLLQSLGADGQGISRVNEMVRGLDIPDLARETVVAHAYETKGEPQVPSNFGPGSLAN